MIKPTVFIFHGYGATPDSNWFPWLKTELEGKGYVVFVPAFPDTDHPNLQRWMDYFNKNYAGKLNKDSILVGHSLGAPMILNILESIDHPVKAAFLVAGFTGQIGPMFDPFIGTVSIRNFNWEKIRKNCKKFFMFSSDNDPYVPYGKTEELHKLLPSKLVIIKGAEHLNAGSGFLTFEELRDAILASF
jgi:hypothetical protein